MIFFLRRLIGSSVIDQESKRTSGKEEVMSNSRLALVIINHAFDKVVSLTCHCGILSEIRSGLMFLFSIFQLLCSLGVIILLLPIIIVDAIDLFLYICRLIDYGCKLVHYKRSSLVSSPSPPQTEGTALDADTSTKEEIIIDEEIINMLNESSESLINHMTTGLKYESHTGNATKNDCLDSSSSMTYVDRNRDFDEEKRGYYYEEEDDDFLSNTNFDKISLIERSFTSRFEVACEQKAA
ncbi:triglyceride-associated lipolysis regulator TLD1 [Saccharomyces eubayanus]|uniref:triglyceride-associated lipolysis regulator TLD1 n=1 Tax=Saccharomyces eubayanus TaxID=1080349 RepID=UPI0006C60B8C|nr:BSC2-like protein [Saccharomyces eubayanus]KOH01103.1 BSC2-like protein [Saccharomyces eubayanus]